MDNGKMPEPVAWRVGNNSYGPFVLRKTLPSGWQYIEALFSADTVQALQAEATEQARLNGMGAEREARLMAQVAALQAEVNDLARRLCLSAEHEIVTDRHVYQMEIERIAHAKDAARIDWIGAHVKAVILHGDTAPLLLWADTELPRYPRDVRSGIDAALAEGER